MAVELNRQNVLQRGYTPPPEEKVAFYVYNQGKFAVERPDSDTDSVLGRYAAEPVAWTSELPPEWHAANGVDPARHAFGPATPAPVQGQVPSGPPTGHIPPRSLPAFRNSDGLGLHSGSPGNDFADLEQVVMDGGGTEIDYPDARQEEVKSDIQEMSQGNLTPIARPEALPAIATARSPRRSPYPAGVRDSIFGITHSPGRAARPVHVAESAGPGTPQTAKVQITIQPPTDPSLSKRPSLTQLNKAAEQAQASNIVQADAGRTSSKLRKKMDKTAAAGATAGPSSSPAGLGLVHAPALERRRSRANSNADSDKTASARGGQATPVPANSGTRSKLNTARNSLATEVPPPPPKDDVKTKHRNSAGGRPSDMNGQGRHVADDWELLNGKGHQEGSKTPQGSGVKQSAPKASSVVSASKSPSALYLQRTQSPSPSSVTQRPRAASPLAAPHRMSKAPSQASFRERAASPSGHSRRQSREIAAFEDGDGALTPRAQSPAVPTRKELTEQEALELLRSPRSVFTVSPSDLAVEVHDSQFHDEDLCILLHVADDPTVHDVVRKAVRKAVRTRLKRLGLENEAQFRAQAAKNQPRHRISVGNAVAQAITPQWARPLFQMLEEAHSRLDNLDQKIEGSRPGTQNTDYAHGVHQHDVPSEDYEPGDDALQSPQTETFSEGTPRRNVGRTPLADIHPDHDYDDDIELYEEDVHVRPNHTTVQEEMYRLRLQDAGKSQGTWDMEDENGRPLPEIPGTEGDTTGDGRGSSLDHEGARMGFSHPLNTGASGQLVMGGGAALTKSSVPPWQLVHQRLLNWALVWSLTELDNALESTERGQQVDECALTIWTTQVYKRYVRSRSTDNTAQTIDRLFVPPNVADAINTAVFNGRHNDAAAMLREMWTPFGFDGMPRLLIVLARHRRDSNHWVVHRFSIPEGTLSTYDTFPEKALADGRPLGWWFAIRAAFPHPSYPHPDHLVQKLVRIHRPAQLLVDNAVAAAAIWRNLIMGSKAERGVDLVRLRDLIHTEIRGLRTRKDLGKLALVAAAKGGVVYDETEN